MFSISRPNNKESNVSVQAIPASENAVVPWQEQAPPVSQYSRILNACLQLIVLVLALVIIGLLSHTLRNYSGSRNIHFGTRTAISWPEDLNLIPAYSFLVLSAANVVVALASALHQGWLVRQKYHAFSLGEGASALSAFIAFALWLAVDGIQAKSEGTPKKDLLKWACKRNTSPTNVLVSYDTICQEQVAVKGIAIVITLIEASIMLAAFVTWRQAKFVSRNVSTPWRIRTSTTHGMP